MNDNDYVFDEEKAIAFIRNYVGDEISSRYTDDEILYISDIIWDYYERNGMLSLNADVTDEEMLDVDKLVTYVRKELRNDEEIEMDNDDIPAIVKGELAYEESLEDFI